MVAETRARSKGDSALCSRRILAGALEIVLRPGDRYGWVKQHGDVMAPVLTITASCRSGTLARKRQSVMDGFHKPAGGGVGAKVGCQRQFAMAKLTM